MLHLIRIVLAPKAIAVLLLAGFTFTAVILSAWHILGAFLIAIITCFRFSELDCLIEVRGVVVQSTLATIEVLVKFKILFFVSESSHRPDSTSLRVTIRLVLIASW